MGEFRIGRSHAKHSYPEPRAASTVPFARNFASGPAADTTFNAATPLQVPFAAIESGAPPSVNVPISPKSTGIMFVVGQVTVQAPAGEGIADVQLQVTVDGVPLAIPQSAKSTISIGAGFATIPVSTILPTMLPGTTHNVGLLVTTDLDGTVLLAQSSVIDIQEVVKATG